jgi:hypothetical protein
MVLISKSIATIFLRLFEANFNIPEILLLMPIDHNQQ